MPTSSAKRPRCRFVTAIARRLAPAVSVLALATVAALPASGQQAAAAESRYATVNGVKLHYLVAGSGPAVVLLHGYTQTSHMWLPVIPRLASAHSVLAPDLRGAGRSGKPETGYDKKTLARDIHALVRSLGYPRVKLVGHDIGLMVAYAYAAQYPDEVESIVLMDAFLPGVGAWKDVWLLRDLWHFHFHGEVPLKLVEGRERIYFEHFWNDFAADRTRSIPEADRKLYAESYAQPGGMRAGFEYFKAFPEDATDFEGFAQTKLPMPMLVLTGKKASGNTLIEQARLVATDVRGIVIEGTGHWLLEEAPDQVIPQLRAFLDGEPSREAGAQPSHDPQHDDALRARLHDCTASAGSSEGAFRSLRRAGSGEGAPDLLQKAAMWIACSPCNPHGSMLFACRWSRSATSPTTSTASSSPELRWLECRCPSTC